MSASISSLAGAAATPGLNADERLRDACRQLEGVFLEQLMKALRDTVPEGGALDGGAGEDIFSGLLDGHLAGEASKGLDSGLAAALYRQLRGVAGQEPAAQATQEPQPSSAHPMSPADRPSSVSGGSS